MVTISACVRSVDAFCTHTLKGMTMEFSYPFDTEQDGDRFLITFAAFPEILSSVSTDEMASGVLRAVALDALKHALQARIDFNDEIPGPPGSLSDVDSTTIVALPPLTSMKLMLYREMRQRGGTKSKFAKDIGITATDVGRLLDLFHDSRSDQLMLAFERLDLVIRTTMEVVSRRA